MRLDDPKAVYLTRDNFSVHGDGIADDTDAIQQAIDKVQETINQGIVFVAEGRYRLTKTIYIWPGVRVIGYGDARPVFVLGENTPGYQDPDKEKLMIFFAGRRPAANAQPPDANPGTFYSAVSNIDLEIRDGNAGAVGVRAHYAQHCFLANGHAHRFRPGGHTRRRQCARGRELPRRPVRHLDGDAFARLASHRRGCQLRGSAGGRDSGARGGPHADPAALQERS